MIFVGHLYHFADWRFHSGHHFHFLVERERLRRGIVGSFGKLDARAHVIDPRADELFLYVVVALDGHAFELHVFHFAVFAGHLHFAGHIHHKVAAAHYALASRRAFRLLRLRVRVRVHPHLDGVIPAAVHVGKEFVIFVEVRHLHHLLHHLLRIGGWPVAVAGWAAVEPVAVAR